MSGPLFSSLRRTRQLLPGHFGVRGPALPDVVLLDRRFKPPKLTRAGFEVLEKGRAILSSVSDLKNSASAGAAPAGPFRLGLSHAIAQPDIGDVIVEMGKRFPLLQPNISNDISPELLAQLHLGKLDGAVVVLPKRMAVPHDLEGVTLGQEEMRPVQGRSSGSRRSTKCPEFYRRSWILNPAGCLIREEIKNRVERLGATLGVAVELSWFATVAHCRKCGCGVVANQLCSDTPTTLSTQRD